MKLPFAAWALPAMLLVACQPALKPAQFSGAFVSVAERQFALREQDGSLTKFQRLS